MTCRLRWCVETETRCRIPIWRTFGRIQWHVIHLNFSSLLIGLPSWFWDCTELIMLISLILVSHFNFLFILCGRLSWLSVSFLLHIKYAVSYRIASYRIVLTVRENITYLLWIETCYSKSEGQSRSSEQTLLTATCDVDKSVAVAAGRTLVLSSVAVVLESRAWVDQRRVPITQFFLYVCHNRHRVTPSK